MGEKMCEIKLYFYKTNLSTFDTENIFSHNDLSFKIDHILL